MLRDPWLTIIGMSDDSAAALTPASRVALSKAETIIGGPRHLALVEAGERGRPWPVPFSVAPVLETRGRPTVVLASGDPFWFGVGGSLSTCLVPDEWNVHPGPSTFSCVAAALGWRLEEVRCLGLHAAPFARLRPDLSPNGRLICLVRDAQAPAALAQWLTENGAGASELSVCERMGGPDQRVRQTTAAEFDLPDVAAPVAVAVVVPEGVGISRASGLPDKLFSHDGQITKRPVRALTLSALAPRPGELLWDIGAGSGSISVEWCLAGGSAVAFEKNADRAATIARNADAFGLSHRMTVIEGVAHELLTGMALPAAVFVGGGGDAALFECLFDLLPARTRLVANGVTLETEALLANLQQEKGGELMRIELARAQPLGPLRGWQPARPIVQWQVVL